MDSWWIGISLALVSAILGNLGLNIQKLSHSLSNNDPLMHNHPLWQLGMGIIIIGSLADFAALGFAPQSVVAPLGAVTLVVNVILARIMHGEEITNAGIIATLCILCGSVLTVVFSDHRNFIVQDTRELVGILAQSGFVMYASIVVIIVVVVWTWAKQSMKMEDLKAQDLVKLKFALPALSGVIGGHSLLFAKFVSELGEQVWKGSWSVPDWRVALGLYVIFGMLVVSLACQIIWINEALKRFNSVFVIPIAKSFWVFFSVVSGLVAFAKYEEFTANEFIMFSLGSLLIIAGMIIFSKTDTATLNRKSSLISFEYQLSKDEEDDFL
jgi:magnesium transporter